MSNHHLTRFIVLAAVAFMCGCVHNPPTVERPTSIYEANAERLKKVRIGLSIQDFQLLFPEAYPGGQNGPTTAYELKKYQEYILKSEKRFRPLDQQFGLYEPPIKRDTQLLWFYFFKDQLVRWGKPNDWPSEPDKIIEIRSR